MACALLLNKHERHWQPILQRGVNLHAVHEECAVACDHDRCLRCTPPPSWRTPSRCPRRSCTPCRPCPARRRTGRRAAPVDSGSRPRRCCRRPRRCPPRRGARGPAPSSRRGSARRARRTAAASVRSAVTESGTRIPAGLPCAGKSDGQHGATTHEGRQCGRACTERTAPPSPATWWAPKRAPRRAPPAQ